MSEAAPPRRVGKRLLRLGAILTAILLVGLLVAGWLLQPQRAGKFLLQKVGSSLGLEISARAIDYRLRGTPQLVLHDVVATRPGDAKAVLRAERVFVSLPWRTIRARGNDLTVQRVELDAPALDLPAVQRWLATRPETGETRIPTLVDGLRITRGRIDNDDWRIEGLSIDVPSLHPERLLRARVRGRYLAPPVSIPADLAIAIAHPRRAHAGQRTGIAAHLSTSPVNPINAASEGEPRLPSLIETPLFRITQEALTNIARHANATQVCISLDRSAAEICLTIGDNGQGFDARQIPNQGLGLLGMKERTLMLGGKLDIQSEVGRGTIVRVAIPL